MKLSFIILTLILPLSLSAQSFTFNHPNCKIKMLKFDPTLEYLKSDFEKYLKIRSFKLSYIEKKHKVFKGDLYLIFEAGHDTSGKYKSNLYKACQTKITIKEAKGSGMQNNDKILYQKSTTRALPRVTFFGKERCSRGLKDTFVHIPYCL